MADPKYMKNIADIFEKNDQALLSSWSDLLKTSGAGSVGAGARNKDAELQTQCRSFIGALKRALASDQATDIAGAGYQDVRDLLGEISHARAIQGFSPTETASFVFSLKEPIFDLLRKAYAQDGLALAEATATVSDLLDQLGLFTTEVYQRSREEVIVRQQQEISELSTPVVELWEGILALPLIGTLDSSRTQVVMENLLQALVDREAEIAIIDITGVPTVDTLVAQHLLKTIAAARLMGADCIVSGIRPQIAQTMVHLGVELSVVSKASLADAFALALQRTDRVVVKTRSLVKA